MDKYLRKPRAQRAQATIEEVPGGNDAPASPPAPQAASAAATQDLIAQLLEQQAALADQITALQRSF